MHVGACVEGSWSKCGLFDSGRRWENDLKPFTRARILYLLFEV